MKNESNKVIQLADKVKMFIGDNLQNVLTGLGISGMDKSMASEFVDITLTDRELEDAYAGDWLVGKVCDLPPFDMTREWRQMDGDMDETKLEQWEKFEKEIKMSEKFKEAMTWGRVYGGAGIIINVDDGQEPDQPLNISAIKKGSLKFLIVSDKQFLHLGRLDNDPLSENYGYPGTYRLAPSSVEIHHTRVIRFEGVPLPLNSRRRNRYWSKSLIERLYSALRHAAEAQENVGALLHESTVDVVRIPELMAMIADPETEKQLQKRFGIAKMQKSVNRMFLMDIEEEYEQHQQTFAGITDVLEKFLDIVSGAADIPITRLFGQSPGGMNSSGDSDIRNYYDHLSARQENELRPKIAYLDKIIYASLFGGEPKDGELDFTFNSLWQMSDEETATLQNTRAERDQKYLDMNIVTEDIIARDLMEKGTYSGVDAEYVKELKGIVDDAEGKGDDRLEGGGFNAPSEDEEADEEEGTQANGDPSEREKKGSQTQKKTGDD